MSNLARHTNTTSNIYKFNIIPVEGYYIWIYAPEENALFYYAHNNEVLVNVGQIVNAGDTIATVGRTGLNAFKKRSPTHLHFMKLVLDKEFYPKLRTQCAARSANSANSQIRNIIVFFRFVQHPL
jgi:hypothetical protein